MQKVFEKIIERLKELKTDNSCRSCQYREKCNEVQETASESTDLCGATMKSLAIEIVNQVASEYGGWIPCSERFPNNGDYILLSFSNFSVPLVGRWEEDEDGGAFYIGDETESCVLQDIFVNAWQPLPPVYKAESEE